MFQVSKLKPGLTGAIVALGLIASPAPAKDGDFVVVWGKEGLEVKSGPFNTMLVDPDTDLRTYRNVVIRSVTVKPRDREMERRMSSADREQLIGAFRTHFARGLGDRLAEEAGDDTLLLSAVITHAWPNTDITGRYLRSRGTGPAGRSVSKGIGSASFEAVLRDAATGKVVAAIADSYSGTGFTSNPNLHTRWGDVRDGFRLWGRRLAREIGGAPGG